MNYTIHQAPTGNPLTDAQLFHFETVAGLYDDQDPSKIDTYSRRAQDIVGWFSPDHRRRLVEALSTYGGRIGASPAQQKAAQKLLDPNSVAVVTGQQAGLFTGPFYSISKALSAIGLAAQLEAQLGRPVVPVFWVASEDHDFAEVDHAYILNHANDVRRVAFPHTFDSHQMVYHRPLVETQVTSVLATLQEELPEVPYKGELLKELRSAWRTGDTLSVWFARLMAKVLEKHPIVILDPCLPELRALVAPVFARTLSSFEALQDHLNNAYQEVEQLGYRPEVVRDEAHSTVFHVVDGKRYVLERQGDQFVTRGLGKTLTLEECLQLATTSAESFSSNVLLRPVIQDHLVPTLAYVGGPSEIAYHPLSRAVFHTHGRKLPPLIMRQRMRVATPGVWRTMKEWKIPFSSIHQPVDLVGQYALNDVATSLSADINSLQGTLTAALRGFTERYEEFGPQVHEMVERQTRQYTGLLKKLEAKVYGLAQRRRSDDVGQLRRIERWFWTDGHEQERRLCPVNVWAQLGREWLGELPTWGDYRNPAPYIDIVVE